MVAQRPPRAAGDGRFSYASESLARCRACDGILGFGSLTSLDRAGLCNRCAAPVPEPVRLPEKLALTTAEACEALGVSPPTLGRWERELGLPVVRAGQVVRYPTEMLREWLARMVG